MRRNLVSLLIGGLAGALVMTLLPAAATEDTAPITEPEATTTQQEEPPPPFLRSHGVRIKAAQTGYCTREQVESDRCVIQDFFATTRKLPVHPGGHVFVNTRLDAADVSVRLHCGSSRTMWQKNDRRWLFHVSRKQGKRRFCDGGSIEITYAEGTGFDGALARYTFSTKPHRH